MLTRNKEGAFVFNLLLMLLSCTGFLHAGEPPRIIASDDIVYEKNLGEEVKLRCRAAAAHEDSNNRTLFFWKNQFGLIRQDRSRWPRYEIKQNKYLRISNIKPEDAGVYTCTATNEFGYKDAKRRLRVFKDGKEIEPIEPPKNLKPSRQRPIPPAVKFMKGSEVAPSIAISRKADPRRIHVIGESIKLKCRVNKADPPPIITWTKDDKSLQLKSNMRLIRGHRYLHFKSLKREDSGNYTCIVANRLGEDSYTFVLEVKSRLKSRGPSIAPSHFTSAPLGGNFSLTCVINAKPKRGMPRVRWVKYTRSSMLVRIFKAPVHAVHLMDPKKYNKDPRTQWRFNNIVNGSIVSSLTFLNVTYADQGLYVCKTGSKRSSKAITSVMVGVKSPVRVTTNIDEPKAKGKGKEFSEEQKEIPLFLLIIVPTVAGLICITVVLIFWRRHRRKEKLAKRSHPHSIKITELEQQPLQNGKVAKLYPDGSLRHNGVLPQNGTTTLSQNGTCPRNGYLSHNGSLSHNGGLSPNGSLSHNGTLSHNGSVNSLRHGVYRTTNGATVTIVHHDPTLGTRLEYISKGSNEA